MADVLNPLWSKFIFALVFLVVMTLKNDTTPSEIRDAMINWYDDHARALPWRSKPHEIPDPYHVWMSEVMLQQTTVAAVQSYFEKFISIWPTVYDLAHACQDDVMREWAGLGYYSRARNLHKCAQIIVNDYDGKFPMDLKALKLLPGIGDYTSGAIKSIAFNMPAIVIDGNVDRVVSRLYAIEKPLPDSKPIIRDFSKELFVGMNQDRPSCFAQSLMDLGATICTPKSPKCSICPVQQYCQAHDKGIEGNLPKKKKKTKIPEKFAIAYIYYYEGKVRIEKRPDKGMLGGMIGFPTSQWDEDAGFLNEGHVDPNVKIRHVFTHFALTLYPIVIRENSHENSARYEKIETIGAIGLPTLFQKLWNVVKSDL